MTECLAEFFDERNLQWQAELESDLISDERNVSTSSNTFIPDLIMSSSVTIS